MSTTTPLTPRERMRLALDHKEADRIPIHDSPWAATVSRWRKEGLPDAIACDEYFGFHLRGFGADLTPQYPVRVLERNEEYIVESTAYGGVRKNHRDYSTTPELIDYGIKSREDWEAQWITDSCSKRVHDPPDHGSGLSNCDLLRLPNAGCSQATRAWTG